MSHPLQSIYDKVPEVNCKGLCGKDRHNTCCGPIACTWMEAKLLDEYDGVKCEWEVTDTPNNCIQAIKSFSDMICPHLGLNGRCTAYEVRPLVCRIWGAVPQMKCPWGCLPKRWLSGDQVTALFREVAEIAKQTK